MSSDIRSLSLPLQKVLDLGEVDRWLRGMAKITPLPSAPAASAELSGFHTHNLHFGSGDAIESGDIESMVGFRHLLAAASKQNIRMDVDSFCRGHLNVTFVPDQPFSGSVIFGRSYANVMPVLFGMTAPAGA
jgi:hypothetical protein